VHDTTEPVIVPGDLSPELPLRERKRLASMRRIQSVALDLFEQKGFDAVTVERIAEVAEVSPSSVYRWFGTKEHLVIWDEYDPMALASIESELDTAPPLEALRRVVRATVLSAFERDDERIRRRLRLAYANPSIEAASTLETYEMGNLIAAVLAAKLERHPDDLEVQVASHGFVGALLGALRHWHDSGFTTPLDEVVGAPLSLLERGIALPR
jgi:AcrR family transcriptional regulator